MKNKIINIPILILVLVAGIFVGIKVGDYLQQETTDLQEYKFNEVLNYTTKYYFKETDPHKLVEYAIEGMFDKLDPHTTYISTEDEKLSEESFRGEFEGIGIEFQIIDDTITVVSPISGGPSYKLGILAGDKITKIEGESCIGFTNKDVIKALRGEKGSKVRVTIYRPINKKEYDFTIIRDKIPLLSVDASLLYQDSVGYISLTKFAGTTTEELIKNLGELRDKGMKKIVLDLRNNPGGLLNQAVSVADLFLDDEKLIVYTEGRVNRFDEQFFCTRTYEYENYPLVVLINNGSASASEIVSGAIQDWDRGFIVGENSFGKGLVQRPFILADNSAIRLTVARYFTPSGRAIQRDYSHGKEEYYSAVHDDSLIAKHDSLKKYKTHGGRIVFGGGGITPDYVVKNSKLTDYSIELSRNNIYYRFIRIYLDHNREKIKSKYGDDFNEFNSGFSMKNELKNLIKFAEKNDVKFNKKDFEKDKDFICHRLKAYIARELFGNSGWYSVLLDYDDQFQKAIKLFDKPILPKGKAE